MCRPLVLVLFVPVIFGYSADACALTQQDIATIKAERATFVNGWNAHSADAMASIWSPQAGDLITPFGKIATGVDSIRALLADEHATFFSATTLTVDSVEDLRGLNATTAILEEDAVISGLKNGSTLQVHITIVFEKEGGQWLVEAARPVIYVPPPA